MVAGGPLRLGVIGCGRFGRSLAAAFARTPRVRVVACADAAPEAARSCAAALRGATALPVEDLLSSPEVDAVAVATPSHTHRAVAGRALEARRHVWCEKPMALSVEDCDALLAAAADARVRFTVGHMQRHFPLLRAVRREVAAGAVGRPEMVTLARREFLERAPGWLRHKESVGGLEFQSSVHEFDFLRAAFGDVARVRALGVGRPLQPHLDFPDGLLVQLEFASGCVGALAACMTDFASAYRGEVNGREGTLHFDLLAGTCRVAARDAARDVAVPAGPLAAGAPLGAARARGDFVAWILDGTPPDVTAWDGRQAVAIACAVGESLRTGRPADVAR